MAGIGLAMLIINATGYLPNWNLTNPTLTIFGIIFIFTEMQLVRNYQ